MEAVEVVLRVVAGERLEVVQFVEEMLELLGVLS